MTAGEVLKGVGIIVALSICAVALDRVEHSALFGPTHASLKTHPELAPSSLALDLSELDPKSARLSIVADDASLNDPVTGLLENPEGRGRAWERPAYVSYADPGQRLVWATRAGLRRHGGGSRTSQRKPSWRLNFRNAYGSDATREPALPQLAVAPAALVVRSELPAFPNALAFEVARQNGAVAPASRPVRVSLNGEDQGHYLLVEHVNADGWGRSHFGHDDFLMFVYRGGRSNDDRSNEGYSELVEWVTTLPGPLTMATVSNRVNLDNLLRHLFTFMFSGTTDWAQGAAVRDDTDAGSRWFWVHWDLDQSFRRTRRSAADRPALALIAEPRRTNERRDVRARIFNRLRQEDPDFGAHFTALATDLLNHRLGTVFLDSLVEEYGYLLNSRQQSELRGHFERRPGMIRAELAEYLDAGPSYHVTIDGPAGLVLDVDGYAEASGYEGRYFSQTPITAGVAEGVSEFSHWIVNGQRRDGRQLVVDILEDTSIRAVMR